MLGDRLTRDEYQKMQKKVAPSPPLLRNVLGAFLVGGGICMIGQFVLNYFSGMGMSKEVAANPTAAVLVALAALLTGLGVYDRLAPFAGMGSALPITGFANAIVAPAMEFKREGWVLGVGARIFQIAGPVILYGLIASLAMGVLHYFFYAPGVSPL